MDAAAVNTVTFVDQNRRFVSTSDDKTMRVWEWDIPVDWKYIADPTMHCMPAVTVSPNGKWLACQSMDNQILIYNALHNFARIQKKVFRGHMVAGYACQLDFSPDMRFASLHSALSYPGEILEFLMLYKFYATKFSIRLRKKGFLTGHSSLRNLDDF